MAQRVVRGVHGLPRDDDALGETGGWTEFGIARKLWGYAAERSPSTHPVAGSPAPDAISALQNFDGISYAKGASVLRQLIAHIGDDAFVAGVAQYLRSHAFGNGELGEFLGAVAEAAGRSLDAWAQAWLRTAGADRLALGRDGVLTREVPAGPPGGPAAHPRRGRLRRRRGGAARGRRRRRADGDRAGGGGPAGGCRGRAERR